MLSYLAALLVLLSPAAHPRSQTTDTSGWRAAKENELKDVIPDRAPVVKERIETEFRTASGITNGKGKYVAGVVLITAGYSADGKYSHFLLTGVPITVGELSLKPGDYVFGWQRGEDSLKVLFYDAQTGKFLGTVDAPRINKIGRIESFRIYPPSEKALIQIGRFGFNYRLNE
ncbi:MAG: hypothetical protein JO033_13525 [Acidobacteriaceae bacterium]|nr:hypothetical protein [Acidobacteriaceae bacterium]